MNLWCLMEEEVKPLMDPKNLAKYNKNVVNKKK